MPKSTKRFTLHTDGLNNHGFRMLTSGADLEGFRKNPVMLWNHRRPSGDLPTQMLPLGTWEDIELKNGSITAVPRFDDDDEFAMRIYNKVESGTIRMASIGAKPLEFSDAPEHMLPNQASKTVTRWTAKEASLCDMGSNPDALAVALYAEDELITLSDYTDLNIKSNMTEAEKAAKEAAAKTIELSTAEQILELTKKNEELQSKLDAKETAETSAKAIALVDKAYDDERIIESQKESLVKLALADYDAAEAAIKLMPKHISAEQRLAGADNAGKEDKKLIELSDKSFGELFKSGDLEYVKLKDMDMFKEKYLAEYGDAAYEKRFGEKPA